MAIDQTTKILIILQAGTESHEGSARALHSVLYAKELADAGATIRLVFDGAGTGWLARWIKNETAASRAAAVFAELRLAGPALRTRSATTAPVRSMSVKT